MFQIKSTPLVIACISSLIFFFRISSFPLHNWDEAWYAEISKNLSEKGKGSIVPFWNGDYYLDKPPLYFWLTYPVFQIFGVGEWQTRFVSATSAVVATVLIFLISKEFTNSDSAVLPVIIFLSAGQVVSRFSQGNLDALQTTTSLATIYFFLCRKISLSGLFLGLGFLVKGFGYGLFPLFWVCLYLLVSKDFFVKIKSIVRLVTVSVFVVFPWVIAGYLEFGTKFIDWYLFHPTATAGLVVGPSVKLTTQLLFDFRYWIAGGLLILLINFKSFRISALLSASLVSVAFYVLVLSFLSESFGWYLLPVYPLLAIVLGSIFAQSYLAKKLFAFIFVLANILQLAPLFQSAAREQDRSIQLATVGLEVRNLVSPGQTVLLDDPDFPAFLYYSNLGQVYTISRSFPKPGEWWGVSEEKLNEFVGSYQNVWLVSSDPGRFHFNSDLISQIPLSSGFQLLHLRSPKML